MKLQHLSVIFVIIIVPISMVLSTYINNMIKVANKQKEYDSALYNATYDAVRAYQMNTLNNSFANVNSSRYRDIKATANSFFNSLRNGLSLNGFTKEDLNNYVPAILFTLYDGYYVYGPYENVATSTTSEITFSTDARNKTQYGLKPYTYYSCEYADGNYDLIVNYTLDNYISVSGWYGSKDNYITMAGYYIDPIGISFNDAAMTVNINRNGKNIVIQPQNLEEYICLIDETKYGGRTVINRATEPTKFKYINYEDDKYYWDDNPNVNSEIYQNNHIPIFKMSGDTRTYINTDMLNDLASFLNVDANQLKTNKDLFRDVNAYHYYKDAYNFSTEAYKALSLIDLSHDNVIKTDSYNKEYTITNENQVNISDESNSSHTKYDYANKKVFDYKDSANNPELDSSSFNEHRMDVIISIIEDTLTNSIANYNNFFASSYDFRMPTITEADWGTIANNVTTVSFLQGLVVGNYKFYNNYSVVANTRNKEFVSKQAIYVENRDNVNTYSDNNTNYHNPRCEEFNSSNPTNVVGYRQIDYEIQSLSQANYDYLDSNGIVHTITSGKESATDATEEDKTIIRNYYYRPGTGGYECVISLNGNKFTSDDLINGAEGTNDAIRTAYIETLAREKNASFKNLEAYNS